MVLASIIVWAVSIILGLIQQAFKSESLDIINCILTIAYVSCFTIGIAVIVTGILIWILN